MTVETMNEGRAEPQPWRAFIGDFAWHRATRIYLFPGLTTILLGQNYHLIHHLYPTIPFFRYGACFRKVRDELVTREASILGS